jgi:hypothetical protein
VSTEDYRQQPYQYQQYEERPTEQITYRSAHAFAEAPQEVADIARYSADIAQHSEPEAAEKPSWERLRARLIRKYH